MKSHNIDIEVTDSLQTKIDNADTYMTVDEMWDKLSQPLTTKESIELFFSGNKRKIKNTYYKVKYGFQRMFRGYDDVETFETFATFLERYTKILKGFRKWGNSYPSEFNSYEDWAKVLDEMINHFELSNEFHDSYKGMKLFDAEQIAHDHADKALEMFVKYFWDLWD